MHQVWWQRRKYLIPAVPVVMTGLKITSQESRDQSTQENGLSKKLEALAIEYTLTLPDALGNVEKLLRQIDGGIGDKEKLRDAIMVAHQLRGSAGSFGLASVGAAFGALEDQLTLIAKHNLIYENQAKVAINSSLELCRLVCSPEGKLQSAVPREADLAPAAPLLSPMQLEEEIETQVDESRQLVLLIEDDPTFIGIVQAVLGSDDHYKNGILSAKTLEEALKILSECEPDVILLDLALPDSVGIETFHAIHKKAPSVPVLILTALDDTPLADESVACGAQDYLVKGRISPDALNRCIRYSVARSRAEQSILRLRAIEDFNAALAHDLRVPAQGADRILEHILDGQLGELSPNLKNALIVLSESNKGLLEKLNRLLVLYSVEYGSVDLEWNVVDPINLIEDIIKTKKLQLENKDLRVEIELEQSGPITEIETDPDMLRNVFEELLNNAIKFSPASGSISVSFEQKENWLTMRISNSGQPIRKEDKKNLFKKFWRGTPGINYVATSGLGLYYCHQIMKLLNGTISCKSIPSTTTFTLKLPSK